MKSFLSFTLIFAAVVLGNAVAPPPADEGAQECASFSFLVQAEYENDIAVACNAHDLFVIDGIVKSIVQLDVLASEVFDGVVPDFDLAFEKYGPGLTIDHTGQLVVEPSEEVINQMMAPEDALTDMYYSAEDLSEKNLVDRRLKRQAEKEQDQPQKRLRGLSDEGALKEDEDKNEDDPMAGWTMIDGGLSGNGPSAGDGRKLQSMDCGNYWTCRKNNWCCQFCGLGCGHRRRKLQDSATSDNTVTSSSPSASPSALPSLSPSSSPSSAPSSQHPSSSPSSSPSSPPSSKHPSAAPSASPSQAPTPEPEDVKLARRVEKMEKRVTKKLTKELRYFARHELIGCLGLYWKLQVNFSTNLADLRAAYEESQN